MYTRHLSGLYTMTSFFNDKDKFVIFLLYSVTFKKGNDDINEVYVYATKPLYREGYAGTSISYKKRLS